MTKTQFDADIDKEVLEELDAALDITGESREQFLVESAKKYANRFRNIRTGKITPVKAHHRRTIGYNAETSSPIYSDKADPCIVTSDGINVCGQSYAMIYMDGTNLEVPSSSIIYGEP